MTEKTKTVLSALKEKASLVCNVANDRIADGLRRTHCVEGGAFLMKGCAFHLHESYRERGYNMQRFFFAERESDGILVQIENSNKGWKNDLLCSLGGQRLAVNVRLVVQGNDLDISIDNGKWLDKTFSGIVSWAVFAPLVVFPIVGAIRQCRLMRDVEKTALSFLELHLNENCIDVSTV